MWVYVPAAGVVLSDWGAEVLKVESPGGDPLRGLTWGGIPPSTEGSFMWDLFNRGKKGIEIDLRRPSGRDVLYEVVKTADVFLVSLLPSTRRAFGIDVDQIFEQNDRIVYALGTGQGSAGPEASRGGYDGITFWNRGGIASSVTPPDLPWPVGMPVGGFGDTLSGLALAGGVAAALAAQARTGRGSVVDGSLLATSLWAMAPGIAASAIARGEVTGRTDERTLGRNPLSATYRTADSRFIVLGMLQPDKYWVGFCDAIERPDLAGDERFITTEQRAAHCDECVAILDEVFGAHLLAEWRVRLMGQEGQWDVVQRLSELPSDRQALANGYVQTGVESANGSLPVVPAPVQHGRRPVPVRSAPRRGEHTRSVLESLRLSEQLLARARRAEGAIQWDDGH